MRQRLHQRGVNGQERIEEVCQTDAVRFGYQSIRCAIAVEAPDAWLLGKRQMCFILSIFAFQLSSAVQLWRCGHEHTVCCLERINVTAKVEFS